MAFMSRDEFLQLAARDPWAARGVFVQAYRGARGDEIERSRLFPLAVAAAPVMVEADWGAGHTFVDDMVCWSEDSADRAAQLTDLCLAQAVGNRAQYWSLIMRRAARQEPKPVPLVSRHRSGRALVKAGL